MEKGKEKKKGVKRNVVLDTKILHSTVLGPHQLEPAPITGKKKRLYLQRRLLEHTLQMRKGSVLPVSRYSQIRLHVCRAVVPILSGPVSGIASDSLVAPPTSIRTRVECNRTCQGGRLAPNGPYPHILPRRWPYMDLSIAFLALARGDPTKKKCRVYNCLMYPCF